MNENTQLLQLTGYKIEKKIFVTDILVPTIPGDLGKKTQT